MDDKEYMTGESITIKCEKGGVQGTFVRLETKDPGSIALAGPVQIMYRKNANPQYLNHLMNPSRIDWSTFETSAKNKQMEGGKIWPTDTGSGLGDRRAIFEYVKKYGFHFSRFKTGPQKAFGNGWVYRFINKTIEDWRVDAKGF